MNQLIKYVRDNNKSPIATIACINVDGVLGIGVSICSKHDKWDKEMGKSIAVGRAYKNATDVYITELPVHRVIKQYGKKQHLGDIIESEMIKMSQRGQKYFQKS